MSYPIITFPECTAAAAVTDDQHNSIVLYLTGIPQRSEADHGFVVIVDRRNDRWSALKTLLLRLAVNFPAPLQKIYVLRPKGFIQVFVDTGLKFLNEEVRCKVLMLKTADELHSHIDLAQLTSDLEGTLQYDHTEWIQHRAAIENFSVNVNRIARLLAQFSVELMETEFPNDVTQTDALIEQHDHKRSEVIEDLGSAVRNGRVLRDCFFASPQGEENVDSLPPCRRSNIAEIDRLLSDLEETSVGFENFWTRHKKRLDQCLQLRTFEEQFKNLQFSCERHLADLSSMTGVGNTLVKATSMLSDWHTFQSNSKEDIWCAKQLNERGLEFIQADHYAVDCIKPKCDELERISTDYWIMFGKREKLLLDSLELHKNIDKANKWCTRGIDMLANQGIEQVTEETKARILITNVEDFVNEIVDLGFENAQQFQNKYSDVLNEELTVMVKEVLAKVDDVKQMCNKRLVRLELVCEAAKVPKVQPVSCAPLKTSRSLVLGHSSFNLSFSGMSSEDESKNSPSPEPKKWRLPFSAKSISQRDLSRSIFYQNVSAGFERRMSNGTNFFGTQTVEELQRNLIQELVATEKVYIDELLSILEAFAKQIDRPEVEKLMPPILKGQLRKIFSNMEAIYLFHSRTFLKDLERCVTIPVMIGQCFLSKTEEFKVYSVYCQARQTSEDLLRKLSDNNKVFKDCQQLLNHHIPLSTHLLKPVQRISKYQHVLETMLKQTDDEMYCEELSEAAKMMSEILRPVNEAVRSVSVKGYDGDLAELGTLLMQGPFSIWVENKKDRKIRSLQFKRLSRHVFLYEQAILFCKARDTVGNERTSFVFKSILKTSFIGITESVKNDKRKFEIWPQDRSQVYVLQAASFEIKTAWLIEIKKLLQDQLERMREISRKVNQSTLIQLSTKLDNEPPVSDNIKALDCAQDCPPLMRPSRSFRRSITIDETMTGKKNAMSSPSLFDLQLKEMSTPNEYVAAGNYVAMEPDQLTVHEGELLRLLEAGADNWWLMESTLSAMQGWVPARYVAAARHLSSSSMQSMESSSSSIHSKKSNESLASKNI